MPIRLIGNRIPGPVSRRISSVSLAGSPSRSPARPAATALLVLLAGGAPAAAAEKRPAAGEEGAAANRAVPGEELWLAGDQAVVVDAAKRTVLDSIEFGEPVSAIAFSPDGTRAFVGTAGVKDEAKGAGGVYVVDAARRRVLSQLSGDPAKDVRLASNGRALHVLESKARAEEKAAAKRRPVKEQYRLHGFDLTGDQPRSTGSFGCGMDIHDFAVSPDQKTAYLLDVAHSVLRIADMPGGAYKEAIELSSGRGEDRGTFRAAPAKLVLDDRGARAAALLHGPAVTGALLIDLDRRASRPILAGSGSSLRAGRFLPGGKSLAVVATDAVLIFDLEAGNIARKVPVDETFGAIAVSGNGAEIYLAAPVALKMKRAFGAGLLEVRDADSFDLLTDIPLPIKARSLAVAPARKKAEERPK